MTAGGEGKLESGYPLLYQLTLNPGNPGRPESPYNHMTCMTALWN